MVKYLGCALLGLIFLLVACSHNDVYFQYKLVNKSGWKQEDVFSFSVDSTLLQEQESYDVLLEITNSMHYPYTNLVIGYDILLNDSLLVSGTKKICLADKYGQWIGHGMYSSFQVSDTLLANFTPQEISDLCIRVGHLLDTDPLDGISKIGIRLTKK